MTDKEISVNAIKNRVRLLITWNVELFRKQKMAVNDEVYFLIYEGLMMFMKSVILNMARYKKKYDLICPLLRKPLPNNITGNEPVEYTVKALYDETTYTANDMFRCFKDYPYTIPRRNIYQVFLQGITQVINEIYPRRLKRRK